MDWNFKRQAWIRKTEKRPQKDFLPHAHLLRVECGGGGQSNKGGFEIKVYFPGFLHVPLNNEMVTTVVSYGSIIYFFPETFVTVHKPS